MLTTVTARPVLTGRDTVLVSGYIRRRLGKYRFSPAVWTSAHSKSGLGWATRLKRRLGERNTADKLRRPPYVAKAVSTYCALRLCALELGDVAGDAKLSRNVEQVRVQTIVLKPTLFPLAIP